MADTGHRGTVEGTCRRCDAELTWVWLTGAKGQRVPVDPERRDQDDEAATLAVSKDHLGRLRARRLDDGERPAPWEWRAMRHLDSCPVLLQAREAAASYRQARRDAPSFHDTEALAEARQQREAARLAVLVDGEHSDGRPAKRGRR